MKSIESQPLKAERVVLACVALHNFLRTHYPSQTDANANDEEDGGGLDGLEVDGESDTEDDSDTEDVDQQETEKQLRDRLRSYLCPGTSSGN